MFGLDLRVLGVFRIYFGGVLLYDLLRRVPYAGLLYSNEGVLSNHRLLFDPQSRPQWSLLVAFSSAEEVRVAFALLGLVYLGYALGLFTRWMQGMALVGLVSLDQRNLFLEDGGVVSCLLLLAFTLPLPLGERYSLDSIRRRWELGPERVMAEDEAPRTLETLWGVVVVVQLAFLYFFNTVHKSGPTWRNGEAVHWVLWQNRVATPLAAWLRMHEPSWFSPLATWGTLVVEGLMPVLLLTPYRTAQARLLGLGLGLALHLGIAALMVLGPFSYAMIGFWWLVQRPETFDLLEQRLRRGRFTCNIVLDPRLPGARRLVRGLVALRGKARGAVVFQEGEGLSAEVDGERLVGLPAVEVACRSVPWVGGALGWVVRGAWGTRLVERWLAERADQRRSPVQPLAGRSEGRSWLREGSALVLGIALLFQLSVDNGAVPEGLRVSPPGPLAALVLYPRLLQGWRMFSPEAPKTDGTVVVDGVTADGRHLDPFTGQAPDFRGASGGLVPHGAPLSDYLFGIHLDDNQRYRGELRRWLEHWRSPDGTPLAQFEVWWVEHDAPPPGSTQQGEPRKTSLLKK